jgi:DNA-binding MltR family transcriptional regulator
MIPQCAAMVVAEEGTMPVEILSYRNQDERDAHAEIEESFDRAAALVSAAFVDERLTAALKARFHQDKKVMKAMFDPGGPLGSFSAKIDLAFLVGMLSKEAIQDLHIIRKIRNKFAHEMKVKSFDASRVRDLIKDLRVIKQAKIRMSGKENALAMEFSPGFDKDAAPSPRDVYIKSCQYFIFILDHYRSIYPSPPSPEL